MRDFSSLDETVSRKKSRNFCVNHARKFPGSPRSRQVIANPGPVLTRKANGEGFREVMRAARAVGVR